jgi:hypothetical protein
MYIHGCTMYILGGYNHGISKDIPCISSLMDIHGISKDKPCICHVYVRGLHIRGIYQAYSESRHKPEIVIPDGSDSELSGPFGPGRPAMICEHHHDCLRNSLLQAVARSSRALAIARPWTRTTKRSRPGPRVPPARGGLCRLGSPSLAGPVPT